MTILTICKTKESIFLSADRQSSEVNFTESGEIIPNAHNNNFLKIFKTRKGFIAGTGHQDLIIDVNKEISLLSNLDNQDKISNIIMKHKLKYLSKDFSLNKGARNIVIKTSWVMIFQNKNKEIKSLYYDSEENTFKDIQTECFIYPSYFCDISKHLSESAFIGYKPIIKEHFPEIKSDSEIRALAWNAQVIKMISKNDDYISKDFDVGILKEDGSKNILHVKSQ